MSKQHWENSRDSFLHYILISPIVLSPTPRLSLWLEQIAKGQTLGGPSSRGMCLHGCSGAVLSVQFLSVHTPAQSWGLKELPYQCPPGPPPAPASVSCRVMGKRNLAQDGGGKQRRNIAKEWSMVLRTEWEKHNRNRLKHWLNECTRSLLDVSPQWNLLFRMTKLSFYHWHLYQLVICEKIRVVMIWYSVTEDTYSNAY